MKEFVLLLRMDITTKEIQPSAQQMELYMEQWMEWINDISQHGQLAEGGNHLQTGGKIIGPKNMISDGPYIEDKQSVAGYIIILAEDLDEAVDIAKKCPILNGERTSVEVRETANPMNIKETDRSNS